METHKGLKNCFCPLFLRATLRGRGQGDDRSIFFIRLASDRAERSGDVYSPFFSTIPVSSQGMQERYERATVTREEKL